MDVYPIYQQNDARHMQRMQRHSRNDQGDF